MKSQGKLFVIATLLFVLFASENGFALTVKEYLQRGEAKQKALDLKGAMGDYDAITAATTMSILFNKGKDLHDLPYLIRAYGHQDAIFMAKGEYGAALDYFDSTRNSKLAGKNGIYVEDCYQWLIRIHQGQKTLADQELSSRLSQTPNTSNVDPDVQVAKYYLGQVTEADLIAFAKKTDSEFTKHKIHESEGAILYYIGMKHFLEGDLAEAEKDLKRILALSHTKLDSQTMARGGLYQIEQAKAQKSTAPAVEKEEVPSETRIPYKSPTGVAVDPQGNVYVADFLNSLIRKIGPDGRVTTLAGSAGVTGSVDGPGTVARFSNPAGVGVDSTGNVYVADYGNSTIRKITPEGVVMTVAGSAGIVGSSDGKGADASFRGPYEVAVDLQSNLYVADMYNDLIRKITPEGVVTTLAGQAGVTGHTNGPGLSASFNEPDGIAVDSSGYVYVADSMNDLIRKITPAGVVSTLAGQAGVKGHRDGNGSSSSFYYPLGIAVDRRGNVYIGDRWNHIIRKITPGGAVTTIAGKAGVGGSTDGKGTDALFDMPCGIAFDSKDDLYVADEIYDRIRKIILYSWGPEVSTLASPETVSGTVTGPAK